MKPPSIGMIPLRLREFFAPAPTFIAAARDIYQATHELNSTSVASLGGLVVGLAVYVTVKANVDFIPDNSTSNKEINYMAPNIGQALTTIMGALAGGTMMAVSHCDIKTGALAGAAASIFALRSASYIGLTPDLPCPQPEAPDRSLPPRKHEPIPVPQHASSPSLDIDDYI